MAEPVTTTFEQLSGMKQRGMFISAEDEQHLDELRRTIGE